jgi:hypothetical protein
MADLRREIEVNVDDNASQTLNKIDRSATKVTQSTEKLTQSTTSHTAAVTKNGGAVAILNGLTGGMFNGFKDASEAIELAGVSLNSFKGIIIASGIGAFVLIVGYLAANWDKVTDALYGTSEAQRTYDEAIEKSKNESRKSAIEIETAFRQLQMQLESNRSSIDGIELAFSNLKKVIPELEKFNITGPKDLAIIKDISKTYFDITQDQAKINANQEKLNILKKEFDESSVGRDGGAYALTVSKLTRDGIKEEIRLNRENQDISLTTQKQKETTLNKLNEIKDLEFRIGLQQSKQNSDQIYINRTIGRRVDLIKKLADEEAALAAAKTKWQADEKIRLEAIKKLRESFTGKLDDLNADTEKLKIDLAEKRAKAELKALRGQKKDEIEIITYFARLRSDIEKKEQETAETERNLKSIDNLIQYLDVIESMNIVSFDAQQARKEAQFIAEVEYWDNVVMISETAQGFLSLLQNESLIKSKEIRIALLLLEKGLAISSIWINEATSSAIAKANAAAVPAFNTVITPAGNVSYPNPAKPIAIASAIKSSVANKVNAGIATAAVLAQTITSLSSSSGGGSGGGLGSSGGPQAQFNIVGSSGTNQLAATIGSQQNQPVKSYVVGSEITSQQELDRNRINSATFL